MTVRQTMLDKLTAELKPVKLDVIDESHKHAGHMGARPEGETHFNVVIVSDAFEGKSRVERHRMVNKALKDELAGPVHALALLAHTPAEAEKMHEI